MTDYEHFTTEEREILSVYFTNIDGPVFALVNLPEVVKGALFARYSRSEKSLRRLFLDEFFNDKEEAERNILEYASRRGDPDGHGDGEAVGTLRARDLYDRVFVEYGDDSVAQLGGAHVACENVSNILTKILERGRLMAYLEQSTRYIRYDTKHAGRYRYKLPPELEVSEAARARKAFEEVCEELFELYSQLFPRVLQYYESRYPKREEEPEAAYRSALRAKVCDSLRGILPAATLANVGIYGSGQSFERLLLRLLSSQLQEARQVGRDMLAELKKVIPSFVRRVDIEDRGVAWRNYLVDTRQQVKRRVFQLLDSRKSDPSSEEFTTEEEAIPLRPLSPHVELVDFDPLGERKIVAAIIFEHSRVSMQQAVKIAEALDHEAVAALIREYVGKRLNRRHLPGRAFESTYYTFEVESDYGSFRDLQRHRILTIEWQQLNPNLGFSMPEVIEEIGESDRWKKAMEKAAVGYEIVQSYSRTTASYIVPMAFRVRYRMQLNAREAMHLIELRTSPQAHPEYREVCNQMARLIEERAGHKSIYEAMCFKGGYVEDLERREAESRALARKQVAR